MSSALRHVFVIPFESNFICKAVQPEDMIKKVEKYYFGCDLTPRRGSDGSVLSLNL